MTEHGICAKCKKSVGCPYADDRITGCKNFVIEPELKLTNEESLRQCNTEQLAEWLCHISDFCEICEKHCDNDTGMQCNGDFKERWVEWLKQPHS